MADFLSPYRGYGNFRGIDVLPYHKLGVGKYAQIGRRYDVAGDPSLNEEDIARVSASFTDGGFHVSVLRH